jgi:predicted nucleic acid-binding protein
MAELTEILGRHAVVGIDTSIFIYHIEGSTRYAGLAGDALIALARGDYQGVTSVLTLMEITVQPLRFGRSIAADEYELLLSSLPNLRIVGVDRDVSRRAAELRAAYRLQPADALQVAACLLHQATAFLTNDKGLRRVTELEVVLLDDFVGVG